MRPCNHFPVDSNPAFAASCFHGTPHQTQEPCHAVGQFRESVGLQGPSRAHKPRRQGLRLRLHPTWGNQNSARCDRQRNGHPHLGPRHDGQKPRMLRSLRIDMCWEGETRPAVSAPFGDFFGIALGRKSAFESALFADPEGRSFNCFVPMRSARPRASRSLMRATRRWRVSSTR